MGFWMTLSRHEAVQVQALLNHPEGAQAGRERLRGAWNQGGLCAFLNEGDVLREPQENVPTLDFIEQNDDIKRNWDGLHVLLTGCADHDEVEHNEPCGWAPARDVVMGGLALAEVGSTERPLDIPLLLTPAEVRAVHSFLCDIDASRLVRERARLVENAGVYSFHMNVGLPDGSSRVMSMVEDGSLAESLEGVRGFYARAAASGNAVIKEIA
ncbi:DUF1877 family protein [Streptomyces sp. NPDC055243]|uniref:DUF1877 family protein n=1 Tax=Streptomyces sp. NPDC055243 TaxID=3365720 RepID=UPI0037D42FFA